MMTSRSRKISRNVLAELQETAAQLFADGLLEPAYLTLDHGLRQGPGSATQQAWLELLQSVPAQQRADHAQAAWLTVQLLGNTRAASEVLTFAQQVRQGRLTPAEAAAVYAYEAWALTRTDRHQDALKLVDDILPLLSGMAAGIAWRARAQALFWSGQSGWKAAFESARAHLQAFARPLGACWLEEGTLLERAGQDAEARTAWREALLLLEHDALYAAWLRHALGQSCLRFALPDAETHYLAMQKAAAKPEAVSLRANAQSGLATARRARGEWARAETGYRQSVRIAEQLGDLEDQRQAWRGLGHTCRLQGKYELALEALMRAASCTEADRASRTSWVYADIAAVQLQQGDIRAAAAALNRTSNLRGESAERAAIVRAELARKAGDLDAARGLLTAVRSETLWAREEARCFPELFSLLEAGRRPAPLSQVGHITAEVRALGTLSVTVNGRPVPLNATGRPGELLVLLLELENRAPAEVLASALYPEAGSLRTKQQALWALVRQLRQALGWDGSVQADDGTYTLDASAQWWYDVREALARGEPTPTFLSGIYQPWAERRASELAQRD